MTLYEILGEEGVQISENYADVICGCSLALLTRLHAALLDDHEDDEDVADDAEHEDDEIEEDDEAAYPRLVDQVLKIIW